MNSLTLVLVLASAFCHALWNALLKRHEESASAVVGVIAVTVVCGAPWTLGLGGTAFPSPPSLGWAVASGVLKGGYLFTLPLGVALPLLVLPHLRTAGEGGALRHKVLLRPLLLVAAGVLCTLSFGSMLVALVHGGAGSVSTLRSTSIAFALGLGVLQGERLSRRQWVGTGVVLLGAVLLGLPRS